VTAGDPDADRDPASDRAGAHGRVQALGPAPRRPDDCVSNVLKRGHVQVPGAPPRRSVSGVCDAAAVLGADRREPRDHRDPLRHRADHRHQGRATPVHPGGADHDSLDGPLPLSRTLRRACLSRGGPVCPEAGLFVPRRACRSRGGLVCPEAGLSVPRRAYLSRGGPVCTL
ncbi:hypothetical protein T484DRAFT_1907830, partial [Baffinella frigidus]